MCEKYLWLMSVGDSVRSGLSKLAAEHVRDVTEQVPREALQSTSVRHHLKPGCSSGTIARA